MLLRFRELAVLTQATDESELHSEAVKSLLE